MAREHTVGERYDGGIASPAGSTAFPEAPDDCAFVCDGPAAIHAPVARNIAITADDQTLDCVIVPPASSYSYT
jgi:hypothetical protein